MCCFSGEVKYVHNTRIFARAEDRVRQFLVYQMSFEAPADLAMILPLPVRFGSSEDAVQFLNLSTYRDFFQDLHAGFPAPRSVSFGCSARNHIPVAAVPPLKVESVGNFEASFVPAIADFNRLDKRFRLENDVWQKLPAYQTYGFAVFQLKAGKHEVHPMALSFPRRQVGSLFFPTVHIHDGLVHAKAVFDHTLYCQPSSATKTGLLNWEESKSLAGSFIVLENAKRIVDGAQHCYRLPLLGNLANQDTYVQNI